MPRAEKDEQPQPQPREAEARTNRRVESPGHTPGKAEGDERDVDEALKREDD